MLSIQLPVPKTIRHQIVHKNVVFIGKTKLVCVILPDKIVKEYVYPPDMVMDGDVLKKDDFRNAFVQWITEAGLKAADTICITNISAIFEKTISPDPKNKSTDTASISAFIDSSPFQHVATVKKQTKEKGVKVIVANRDLLSSIYHGLEKSACNMLGIYPELILIADTITPDQNVDIVERAKKHLTMYTLKNNQQYVFDIFPHTHKSLAQMSVVEAAQQPVQPWVVVVVVLMLIGGGVGIWYMQYFQVRQTQIALARKRAQLLAEQQSVQTSDPGKTNMVPVAANNPVTPTQGAPIATASATLSPTPQPLRVQIIYTSRTQKLFDDMYNKLRQTGLYQISNQMSTRDIQENKILVASSLDTSVTARMNETAREVGIQATTKQATIDGFDIVIELGIYSPVAPIEPSPSPTP
jgi:hypothetical protein